MDEKLDSILTRGVVNIISDKNALKNALSTRKLNVYLGIDPTAPRIHLGHAVALFKLQKFIEEGHHVTLVIGDFTALIGDTSDKESERPILTEEEIKQNFATYREQASKILDFDKVEIKNNSEWLSNLSFKDIIALTQKFTLNDFISRELIKKRLSDGGSVRLHEVLYPVMQGYDSLHLKTDLQIGGADQTFNMQAGRTLIKLEEGRESYVMSLDYLPGTDGRKMSKSWGNAIWLDDSANDMYGKIMSITDDVILKYFELLTDISTEDIKKSLETSENPINIKKRLAKTIVTTIYSEEAAAQAEENFTNTIQNKEIPEDIPTVEINADEHMVITDLLVKLNLAPSKSEAKRLVEQGGVEIDSDKVDSAFDEVVPSDNMLIKAGKRNYVRIKLSS